jgi:putative photosynthetic complex assembly protein
MTRANQDRRFPRGALAGAASLIGLALMATAFARVSGIGTTYVPVAGALESRDLRFEDRADGGVAVFENGSGRLVEVVSPGTNGFLRGVLRGMARDRRQQHIGAELPFRLTRWDDGRLSIEDVGTHQRIELVPFGPTNIAVFARLLSDARLSQ